MAASIVNDDAVDPTNGIRRYALDVLRQRVPALVDDDADRHGHRLTEAFLTFVDAFARQRNEYLPATEANHADFVDTLVNAVAHCDGAAVFARHCPDRWPRAMRARSVRFSEIAAPVDIEQILDNWRTAAWTCCGSDVSVAIFTSRSSRRPTSVAFARWTAAASSFAAASAAANDDDHCIMREMSIQYGIDAPNDDDDDDDADGLDTVHRSIDWETVNRAMMPLRNEVAAMTKRHGVDSVRVEIMINVEFVPRRVEQVETYLGSVVCSLAYRIQAMTPPVAAARTVRVVTTKNDIGTDTRDT